MLRKLLSSLVLAGLVSSSAFAANYEIDPAHTAAVFYVKHLGVSNTHGRFNKVSGSFVLDGDISKNRIEVKIVADSIDSNDEKRDKHLKGPDFFNTKQFPTLSFVSKSFKKLNDSTFEVVGDITIKGVTKTITVKAVKVGEGKDPWGGTRAGLETTFTIKRGDFGISFMPGGIGEDVTITFAVEGIQK